MKSSDKPIPPPIPCLDIKNVSFIVNTKKCGEGELVCTATHPDGKRARVAIERVETHIYRVRIFPLTTGPLHLHLDVAAPWPPPATLTTTRTTRPSRPPPPKTHSVPVAPVYDDTVDQQLQRHQLKPVRSVRGIKL